VAIPIKKQKYTYEDYLSWTEENYEIIEGEAYMMSPAPSRAHQEMSGNIFFHIKSYLQGKKCKVYAAPFDVRLSKEGYSEDKIKTVVQPDITVICDDDKLDDRGAVGAPDFIVEIVSPSSTFLDYVKKLNIYGDFGVKEYWIVDPKDKNVLVYKIDENGVYGKPEIYEKDDEIKVSIFDDLVIDLKTIF
jgi:Uma2 family endonuclease